LLLKHIIITVLVILAIIVPTYFFVQWFFDNHPISLIPAKETPMHGPKKTNFRKSIVGCDG
jgi:hypothetical protein